MPGDTKQGIPGNRGPGTVTRDRSRELGRAAMVRAIDAGKVPKDSVALVGLALELLTILVDLTGQGDRPAYAGREYLGGELARRLGRTVAYCVRHTGRVLALLRAADLITVHWGPWKKPCFRGLSPSLKADLASLAGRRRKPPKPKEPSGPPPTPPFRCGEESCGWQGGGEACAVDPTHDRAPP